jgi:hypothetical protein
MDTDKFLVQKQFLQKIEDVIPSNNTLVGELGDILEISPDSAYRRIRGETLLTIDEITRLCRHFRVSFDAFDEPDSGSVTFQYTRMNSEEVNFEAFLQSIFTDLKKIIASKEKLIYYACEDVPVFQNYNFAELSAFKIFYWMKSIMNVPAMEKEKFDLTMVPDNLKLIGKQIFDIYSQVPSIEIWTDTTIHSTLKQILFYWESGMFKTREDAIAVCNALRRELENIQQQAEIGKKYLNGDKSLGFAADYVVYHSDIEITNNCVLVNMGGANMVYLGHQSFNAMSTSNNTYCFETRKWFDNIIRKSTLISGVSEKLRYQFF